MVQLHELISYSDRFLESARFQDYAPNGLQVEGRAEVRSLVCGVTACQALLDAAVARGADAVLVHHGYFWKGEPAPIVGMKRNRLKTLLEHDISLIAYHLPLDAHPQVGNNARLGELFGVEVEGRLPAPDGLGLYGTLRAPLEARAFAVQLTTLLGREPLHIAGTDRPLRRIGWCSGAAQGYLAEAAALGLDAFVSGEISEHTVHTAREMGIDYYAAGHHATERYGVQALAEHLAQVFDLEQDFVDVENPV